MTADARALMERMEKLAGTLYDAAADVKEIMDDVGRAIARVAEGEHKHSASSWDPKICECGQVLVPLSMTSASGEARTIDVDFDRAARPNPEGAAKRSTYCDVLNERTGLRSCLRRSGHGGECEADEEFAKRLDTPPPSPASEVRRCAREGCGHPVSSHAIDYGCCVERCSCPSVPPAAPVCEPGSHLGPFVGHNDGWECRACLGWFTDLQPVRPQPAAPVVANGDREKAATYARWLLGRADQLDAHNPDVFMGGTALDLRMIANWLSTLHAADAEVRNGK